jgi:membrane dipeptidase
VTSGTSSSTQNPVASSYDEMVSIDMLMHWDIAGYRGHMPATTVDDADAESWHPYDTRSAQEMFADLHKGGLTAAHASVAIWQNARRALDVVANWRHHILENSDLVVPVKCAADIKKAKELNRTGIFLGFQNTDPYENDLNLVGAFRELGVVCAQLSYNQQNGVAGGAWEDVDSGLTRTGRNMVREMNKVGVLIDLSHCAERTCLETIEHSDKPVAITHANPVEFGELDKQTFYGSGRNKSIVILKELADAGGMLGLTTYTRLLPDREATTVERFCEMAEWTAELVGIEKLGFGSDYGYGYNQIDRAWVRSGKWTREPIIKYEPLEFDHPAWSGPHGMRVIADALLARGWSVQDVSGFIGGNWLRFLGQIIG